jgi:hypothetical protein
MMYRQTCFGALLALALCAPVFVSAQVPDQILDLTVTATIAKDGSTRFEEVVLYDFGPKRVHGIYRNLPLQAQEGNTLRKFGIEEISVTDREGKVIPFETIDERTHLRLKIGDPDTFITGVMEYRILYTARTLMRGFSKFDEWLWDATSSNWPVQILRARVSVVFPEPLPIQDVIRSCVTVPPGGVVGEETCQVGFVDRTEDGRTPSIQMMDLNLAPKESMHVGLGFPKGFIDGVPEARPPLSGKAAPLAQVLPAVFMVILIGVAGREVLRRKWPHLAKE